MEVALQGESRGIHYEGWDKQWIQCIFEEGEVEGRNERYEFRCDASLQCCGRICCTPEVMIIPLWLMIIFIILALLLLLAILGTIAYLCAKRKPKPKKQVAEYTALTKDRNSNGEKGLLSDDHYSTPDYLADRYRNGANGSTRGSTNQGYALDRQLDVRRDYGGPAYGRDRYGMYGGRRGSGSDEDTGSVVRHGMTETYEASYKEEVVYEKAGSTDSKEML